MDLDYHGRLLLVQYKGCEVLDEVLDEVLGSAIISKGIKYRCKCGAQCKPGFELGDHIVVTNLPVWDCPNCGHFTYSEAIYELFRSRSLEGRIHRKVAFNYDDIVAEGLLEIPL